jgi:hypothetical protein
LLERRLVQVALLSWLVFEVPHFIFHVGQTHHFSPGSNLSQVGGLGFLIVLPLVFLFLPPQKGVRRNLGDTSIDRTERMHTR